MAVVAQAEVEATVLLAVDMVLWEPNSILLQLGMLLQVAVAAIDYRLDQKYS